MSQRRVVDASSTPVPNSPMQLTSSNVCSPNGSGSDLYGMGTRSGSTTDEKIDALLSKFVHFEMQIAQIPALTTWMSRMDSFITKTIGNFADPQPHGPMAQGHLMTTETQDEDLIHSPAPKMNNPVVPFYYDTLANNTTTGLPSGSITFGKNPTCQPTTDLLQFIVKQVPRQSGLYLKHEPNVRTLLLDIFLYAINSPFHCTNTSIIVRQSKSIEDREIGNNLHICGESWLTSSNFSSLMEMTKVHSSSQRLTLARKSSASKIEEVELASRCWNLFFLEADKL